MPDLADVEWTPKYAPDTKVTCVSKPKNIEGKIVRPHLGLEGEGSYLVQEASGRTFNALEGHVFLPGEKVDTLPKVSLEAGLVESYRGTCLCGEELTGTAGEGYSVNLCQNLCSRHYGPYIEMCNKNSLEEKEYIREISTRMPS